MVSIVMAENETIRAAQSQIICIPFSVPYKMSLPESNIGDSATAAESWGLSVNNQVLSRYFPYNAVPSTEVLSNAPLINPVTGEPYVDQQAQTGEEWLPLSSDFDIIRKTAFSFIRDKRFTNNDDKTIQLIRQIGEGTTKLTAVVSSGVYKGESYEYTHGWEIGNQNATHTINIGAAGAKQTISAKELVTVGDSFDAVYTHTEPYGQEVPGFLSLRRQDLKFKFDTQSPWKAGLEWDDAYKASQAISLKALLELLYPFNNGKLDLSVFGGSSPMFQQAQGKSFIDATYMINKPFVEIAYKESFGDQHGFSDAVNIKANYNFYLQPYEKITKDLLVNMNYLLAAGGQEKVPLPEWVLPNMYAMLIDSNHDSATYEFKHADNWHPHLTLMAGKGSWTWSTHSIGLGAYIPNWLIPTGKLAIQHAGQPVTKTIPMETHSEYLNTFATKLKEVSEIPNNGALHHPGHSLEHILNRRKYSTVGVSANKLKDFMEEADKIKKFFPMYTDIEIPAANGGKIGKMLYESQTLDQFMQLTMAAMYPKHSVAGESTHQPKSFKSAIIKKDSFIKKDDSNEDNISLQEDNLYSDQLLKLRLNKFLEEGTMLNISDSKEEQDWAAGKIYMKWIETHITDESDSVSTSTINMLNNSFEGSAAITGGHGAGFVKPVIFGAKGAPPVPWISNIKWMATRNKINKFIREKTRTVYDVYNGDYAYSEVLFYEVAKFSLSRGQKTFVQNIFLPNVPGMEVLKYIDTQVKFGEEYYYQVYAHTLVVGTHYQLGKPAYLPSADKVSATYMNIILSYDFAPSVYLIRTPYYNTPVTMNGALHAPNFNPNSDEIMQDSVVFSPEKLEKTPVWDKPPVFPDINFLPLYGERDKILLNVNFNIGEYDLKPVFIDPGEDGTFDTIKKNQKRTGDNDEITFRGDDFCGQIEVLRIDKKPFSYADYAPVSNHRIAILGGSSAFGFVDDTLQPNKDYYYIARAKDAHGNYSNPSPVYHVRVVAKEGEAPYAIIDMFFIEEVAEKKRKHRKSLMKYIRIQPSFKQTYLHEGALKELPSVDEVNTTNLPELIGDPQLSRVVFGEKFKFRFTSKKTGKRFDLNLFIKNPSLADGEDKSTKGVQGTYSSGKC